MRILLLELPIGLDFMEVLLHLLNFAILLVALRFLLYKPIKNFMAKRIKEYTDREESGRKALADAKEQKTKYEQMMEEGEKEVAKVAAEAAVVTKKNSDEIIKEARLQASEIIKNAKDEAQIETEKLMPELKDKSGELAIAVAEKILERKITEKDTDKLIDECLSSWSGK